MVEEYLDGGKIGGDRQEGGLIGGDVTREQDVNEMIQKRDRIFMVLQCRILQDLGFDSNGLLDAFADAHINPGLPKQTETESAFLRGIIENELRGMGDDGMIQLNEELSNMKNPYTGKSEIINDVVEGLKQDFLTGLNNPVISAYAHRRKE
jgi:hypothetical protein